MSFYTTLTTKDTVTANNMPAHSTTGSALVDLFFKMGSSRNTDEKELEVLFSAAFAEDPLLATKAAFYNRDVRGGQGERRSFRIFFRYLCEMFPEIAAINLHLVPHYGRWDDLLVAEGTKVEYWAFVYIMTALIEGDKLAAKWMPRKGRVATKLRNFMGLTPKAYRQLLVQNTNVVESLMCSKQWSEIEYSHVPSLAIKKYRKAWARNDGERYSNWLDSLAKGKVKVNAGTLFPHDIVHRLRYGQDSLLEEQWKALPDYMPKGRRILPVSDVSGSMRDLISPSSNVSALDVSIALGLYISERNEGPFRDLVLTFSESPQLHKVQGADLHSRINSLRRADWGYNTNLERTFDLILDKALEYGLPAHEMPEVVLILSDMQFDVAVDADASAFEMIRDKYLTAGYEMPKIVFWNLLAYNNVPVKQDERGVALVSGYSPSILLSVLSGENFNPLDIVLQTLNSERYALVEAAYLALIECNDRKLEAIRSGKADAETLRANIQAFLGRTPQEPKAA